MDPIPDLTGTWRANTGGTYYIRHLVDDDDKGQTVWWVGMSGGDDGAFATNVFTGFLAGGWPLFNGDWADVPRGSTTGHGNLAFLVIDANRLERQTETGGFGASVWTRI